MFKTIRRIVSRAGDRKKRLYMGFVWEFLHTGFTALPIVGAAQVLNIMLQERRGEITPSPVWALYALAFMAFAVFGRFLFSCLRYNSQDSMGYEIAADERVRIGDILKRVSLGFFDRHKTGKISGAVTTELGFFETQALQMVDTVINGYIHALVMLLFLAFYSVPIALIALCGIVLSALSLRMLSERSRKNAATRQRAQDDMIAATLEYARGISIVKAYGQEGVAIRGVRDAYRNSRAVNLKIEQGFIRAEGFNTPPLGAVKKVLNPECNSTGERTIPRCLRRGSFIPFSVMHWLSLKLASVALAVAAALSALNGSIGIPTFLALAVFSFVVFGRLEKTNTAVHILKVLESTMDKLDKIGEAEFIDENGKDRPLAHFDIQMREVSFGYGNRKVLKDVSFHIPQNTTTAIAGPSGSGKTTICNLIARFYDADSGAVTIGGADIRDLTCDSLLSNVSMVFQNVYLFNDTIGNNIRFGKPGATDGEVAEAAKQAMCHDFIAALPEGYDTIVGEGGSTLSGGEKQRISIARAMLKNAPIVILDEATASVDPENEHLIQRAISALTHGKTIVVIAHRLATIEKADQILVVDDGRIAQSGTHKELAGRDGVYRRFVEIRERAEGWRIA